MPEQPPRSMVLVDADAVPDLSVPGVLIVDDDPFFLDLVRLALRAVRCELLLARSGAEALALVKASCPRLVLLDHRLPGMGGLETLRALTADCPGATVVIVSGSDEEGDLASLRAAGAVDIWSKPLDVRALPQRVQALLERP